MSKPPAFQLYADDFGATIAQLKSAGVKFCTLKKTLKKRLTKNKIPLK